MTKYEVDWEALHTVTIEANSKAEAIKAVRLIAKRDESFCYITDGPHVDEICSEDP